MITKEFELILRNSVSRDNMRSEHAKKHTKRPRITKVDLAFIAKNDERLDMIVEGKRMKRQQENTQVVYLRITPQRAVVITKEQYMFFAEPTEKNEAYVSLEGWTYLWTTKGEINRILESFNVKLSK